MTDQERAKVITDDFSFWGPAQGDFHSERARCTQLITAALAAVRESEREACSKAHIVVGTDGCSTCEHGRVTMFVLNKQCRVCAREERARSEAK